MPGSDDDVADRKLSKRLIKQLQDKLNYTEEAVRQLSNRELASAEQKLEIEDRPMARLLFELDNHCGDSGTIPVDGPTRALEQAEQARASSPSLSTDIAGVPTGSSLFSIDARVEMPLAGLTATSGWTAHGPGNIGGRTRAIAIDPTNTARIYAAGAGGGVWRSTDSGTSWIPLDDRMANLAVCSLAIDPSNSNTLYAGTGEGFGNADAQRGDGIFRSTDGGLTWTQLATTAANPNFFQVNSLAITPNGQTLLAATGNGIYRSTNSGVGWNQASSINTGNLQIDPNDANKAIAGGLGNGRAYFSTDGGASWTSATRPTTTGGRVQVCYAAADSSVTYASVQANPSQIWRSTNGGQSYSSRNANAGASPANFLGAQGWYDNIIWAGDPTDPNLVIVGGIDLWRSTNAGNNLTRISTWQSDDSVHADHHTIVSDPGYNGTTNRRVYFGNDGGIHRTDDATTAGNNASAPFTNGWVNLNNGYGVTQFYYGDGHLGTNTIVAGAQDNGTLRFTPAQGENGWNSVWGGDGGDVASDPSDSQIWYGEYVYLQIFRDSTGGAGGDFPNGYICGRYWDNGWKWKPAPFTITDAKNDDAQFIAPFELDPNDPDRLLGGALSLWRTNDAKTANSINPPGGPSWETIKDAIGSSGRTHGITAIAIAHGDSDVVVVGHANGSVFRSTNATANTPTWLQVETNGIGANRKCLSVTIDPDDHAVIYASFAGYQSDNLWGSADGGQTWTDMSGNLPDAPIFDVTIHPQRSSWLYAATEVGLFASEDGGQTWSPTNEGPANVSCRDLFWMGCRLVVVTHGRGTFEINLHIANAFPAPNVVMTGSENVNVRGNQFTRYKLSVTNRAEFPNSLFLPSRDLPPCGLNTVSARTWVDIHNADTDQRIYGFCALRSSSDLDNIWFAVAHGTAPPSAVYVVLRDRRCPSNFQSNDVSLGPSRTRTRFKFLDDIQTTNKFTDDGGPATANKFRDDIQTRNKFTDDGGPSTRFKFIDDGPTTRNKFADDGGVPTTRNKFIDDGGSGGGRSANKALDDVKSPALDPGPSPRVPAGLLPFALATPHHAAPSAVAAAGGAGQIDHGELIAAIEELDEYVSALADLFQQGGGGYDYAELEAEYGSAAAELQHAIEVYNDLASGAGA